MTREPINDEPNNTNSKEDRAKTARFIAEQTKIMLEMAHHKPSLDRITPLLKKLLAILDEMDRSEREADV